MKMAVLREAFQDEKWEAPTQKRIKPLSESSGHLPKGDAMIIVVNGQVYSGKTLAEAMTKAREDQKDRSTR